MKQIMKSRSVQLSIFLMLFSGAVIQAEVTVKQSGSTLNFRGDRAADSVQLTGLGINVVSVVVNGGTAAVFSNVQNIKINMGKGVDYVRISSVRIEGNLEINMGGDWGDWVEMLDVFGNSLIGGQLTIKGGSYYNLTRCYIHKNLVIQAGLSTDLTGFGQTMFLQNLTVAGSATIRGNNRLSDYVDVYSCSVLGNLDVRLGGGDDRFLVNNLFVVGNLSHDGGRGYDRVVVFDLFVVGLVLEKNFEAFGL